MTQNRMTHQALIDQLEGADTDTLRRVLEHAMQRLIEAEAATQIGAQPHERVSTRTTYRNGYRERILDTGSGRLELQIPKLRPSPGDKDKEHEACDAAEPAENDQGSNDQDSNDRSAPDAVCSPATAAAEDHGDGTNQGPGSGGSDQGQSGPDGGDGGSDN